jgi:protocatechuate 3,4-dioxygenase beta subunit
MHDHDRGLEFDLATLRSRRAALALFGGASLAVLAGCGTGSDVATAATATTTTAAGTTGAGAAGPLDEIPEETAGPFPGDGSNGPDVLGENGIVRADIRSSFGGASGTAAGVPLRIELTVVEADTGAALPGAAVYLWHCDRNGDYSLYAQAVSGENYLRGVQAADGSGTLAFTSIFPAAYSGRWPHAHFEIYRSLDDATGGGDKLATVTGDVASGYVATLTVPV